MPRLNPQQIQAIKNLALEFFNSNNVWIFGSRANMNLKGGDIDIYLETNKTDNILKAKLAFLREFDKEFGEQKVDLLVNNHQNEQEIYNIAKSEGVKI